MNQFHNNRTYISMAEGFMSKVYGWMTAGLCLTAAAAYSLSPSVNPGLFQAVAPYLMVFALIQFGVAMYFSFAWKTSNFMTLAGLFIVYSLLTGVILAPLAYIYTGESLFQVFLIAAAMFGTMAVYGSVTKSDLSSMGNILMMALIGLVIANLVNMFLQSAQFDILIACVGVGAFAMLTAYDVQMLRKLGYQAVGTQEEVNKIALVGALSLYLNVINLFIYLLKLFGKKRNN
ncbi:Bax inhibitor-1/YccA family protein [Candidatus Chromulinivorax destructor]|uniref:Bax inhibitor-1/YccA family protein n=1 Tax=Candidatus Chromulinivorax destructor TaxID=2066483 RepID=A0A345ZC96_9BACT|nr:Bax inhibitor-1/YccA family protein [Candidatus Chromulinivorax destructor]AXK60913.1 hypothetical protein C0J27_04165 [Candidatus Chromulinivorax destructor]